MQAKKYDAMIIGGGPAGVSCAVWLARLGLAPVLLEAGSQIGGLCRINPFQDDWNASLPGMTGMQIADNLDLSLQQAGVTALLSHVVERVERVGEDFVAAIADAPELVVTATHLVLATGVTARRLPEMEATPVMRFDERSVLSSALDAAPGVLIGPGVHIVAQDFKQKRVAVLGGGDNAFENALYATQHGAACVDVYARSVRAQQQFVRQVPSGQVHEGDYRIDTQARTVNGQHYDLIMVFYGWEPSTHFADGLNLRRTAQGYIETDSVMAQTSCPRVYAIGEVTQRQHPCVVTALADGVAAAKAIQASIEQSTGNP